MELQPLEDDALLYRDVVLLLKCAKSVNWVIQAHGLVGKLDIVVSLQSFNSFLHRNTTGTTKGFYSLITHHRQKKCHFFTAGQRFCRTKMCGGVWPPVCERVVFIRIGKTVKIHRKTHGFVITFRVQRNIFVETRLAADSQCPPAPKKTLYTYFFWHKTHLNPTGSYFLYAHVK